jgi:histone deacetylase 1/2
LKLFLLNKGISHRLSCPYTPKQNGVAERKHRHIIETTITLLRTAKLPSKFWSYACQTATYLINRMPTVVLHNSSPFEMLFGSSPTITHLRIFGCACFPLLKPYNSTKLQAKTTKCVFLGYATKYKGYLCYHVPTMRMFVSRHVIFDEHQFPYSDLVSTPSNTLQSSPLSSCPVTIINTANSIVSTSSVSPSHPSTTHTLAPSIDSVSPQSITAPLSTSSLLPVAPDISMQSNLDSHGFIPDNL